MCYKVSPLAAHRVMSSYSCPICSNKQSQYLFHSHGAPVISCPGCSLVSRDLSKVRPASNQDFDMRQTIFAPEDDATEDDFAARCVEHLIARELTGKKVLVVAQNPMPGLERALTGAGYEYRYSPDIREHCFIPEQFDSIVLPYSLEKFDNPAAVLETCNIHLKTGGLLLVSTQTVDSKWVKFLGKQWTGWRPENLFYFNRKTIQLLLEQHGFRRMAFAKDSRLYSLQHVLARAKVYPRSTVTNGARLLSCLPQALRRSATARVQSSGLFVSACKAPSSPQSLSIIMPVFNERDSFADTLQKVLAKEVEGIGTKEVLIIESNSTDGTRELVKQFENHPQVKVVYEEKPRGKGHAVRVGFEHATGDFILIQDADSEYDVDDYDALLEPLLNNRELFILGTRHTGSWKMRTFTDQPSLAIVMNFGQIVFTTLMNVLYNQRMTDPFTMYKVLRRECLHGINFECNRFDFDHELVIKLVLKGYTAFEIPVNYNSRSYSEGKKVTFVVDPLLWIRANFKFRFTSPYTRDYQNWVAAAVGKPHTTNDQKRDLVVQHLREAASKSRATGTATSTDSVGSLQNR